MKNIKLFETYLRGGMKQISVDLDSEDFLQLCQEIIEEFHLQIINLKPLGPGGGNPEVTFRGDALDLFSFVEWYTELSGDDDAQGFYDEYVTDDEPIQFEDFSDGRMSTRGNRRHVGPGGRPKF